MSDLLHILPAFPAKQYTHLIPSLEKNLVTTTDLLTLDAVDVAKRARLPTLDVRRLTCHVVEAIQAQFGLDNSSGLPELRSTGTALKQKWASISTLDPAIDAVLGGGIPSGYITELTGESGAGKTQFLLTLLLSAQLPVPYGVSRPTLYISTEHPLPTNRLDQLLNTHPILTSASPPASLARILTLQTPDLETQEHILAYQLPVALRTRNIGLVVIDSIAANYRAEASSLSPKTPKAVTQAGPGALAARAADLARTGALLRDLARTYSCAIVVANQVADRFAGPSPHLATLSQQQLSSSSPSEPPSQALISDRITPGRERELRHGWAVHPALSLDWQQQFFTGWGNESSSAARHGDEKGKTPALGLVWANQIACRVALAKEAAWVTKTAAEMMVVDQSLAEESSEWTPRKWRRWLRVAFAPWVEAAGDGEKGVEFQIWKGGISAVDSGTST